MSMSQVLMHADFQNFLGERRGNPLLHPPLRLCRTAPPERRKSAPGISDFPPPTFLQIENPA